MQEQKFLEMEKGIYMGKDQGEERMEWMEGEAVTVATEETATTLVMVENLMGIKNWLVSVVLVEGKVLIGILMGKMEEDAFVYK